MIRLGLCCMFRDQPIKFVTTTAIASRLKCPFGSGEAWMALELVQESLKVVSGTVEYPPPFDMFS